jgi:hypothetical protein
MLASRIAEQVKSGNVRTKARAAEAAASLKKAQRKKEGTRAGVLVDWRASGKGKGASDTGGRDRLRDGN